MADSIAEKGMEVKMTFDAHEHVSSLNNLAREMVRSFQGGTRTDR